MFRIVPIDPSKRRPLHESLSTSSHDHTDPDKGGIILTIGRTGCDVNFPDMDRVDSVSAVLGGDPSAHTVKITADVSGPGIPRHTSDFTMTLDKNLFDLTWAVSETTDGGQSYVWTVPYDCNVPGLDKKRIQKVPLSTRLAELTKSWPMRSKIHFTFIVGDDAVRRPKIVGPHQILWLITRPDLIGKSWPIKNKDGSDGIRCYMPARSREEKEACRAASDGIALIVEQGENCDPRIPLTRILNGKQPEPNKKINLRIVGYGSRIVDTRPFAVGIRETQTVYDLMASIEAQRKISPMLQCLSVKRRELSDVTARLVDWGLEDRSTVILTRRVMPSPVSAPLSVSTRRTIKTSKRKQNLPGPKARMALTSLSLLSDAKSREQDGLNPIDITDSHIL